MNERTSASPKAPANDCIVCSIDGIPSPVKRMLRMQFKEFVHHIEDAEEGLGVTDQLIRTTIREQRVA